MKKKRRNWSITCDERALAWTVLAFSIISTIAAISTVIIFILYLRDDIWDSLGNDKYPPILPWKINDFFMDVIVYYFGIHAGTTLISIFVSCFSSEERGEYLFIEIPCLILPFVGAFCIMAKSILVLKAY